MIKANIEAEIEANIEAEIEANIEAEIEAIKKEKDKNYEEIKKLDRIMESYKRMKKKAS